MPSTILSDNGVSSGTAGIKTTGSNDGQLALQTTTAGGTATTAMTIDTSQNVGIGTSSPVTQLTLAKANDLVFTQNGYGMTWGADNGSPRIYGTSGGTLGFKHGGGSVGMALDSSGNFQFNSGYGSAATAYGCRAWVNFNGTGTVAIRASGNVTSITDNGTGDYTVNFTTAMPDANYNAVSMGQRNDFNNGDMNISIYGNVYGSAITTSSIRVNSAHASSYTLSDALTVCVAVFR